MNRTSHVFGYVGAAVAAAGVALSAISAQAQSYPTRQVELVVPYGPGGTGDLIARVLSAKLEARLHAPFVIINRPGANGSIGATSVMRAPADGYTLLMGYTNEMVIAPEMSKELTYRADSFEPIALAGQTPLVFVSGVQVPVNTLQELVATIRSSAKHYTYAAGLGSPPYFAAEMFKRAAGIELDHVYYKGSAQGVNDVLGGHVDFYFSGMPAARSLVDGGKLKAFAVTGKGRSPSLPKVPTMAEAGVPGLQLYGWFSLFAPKGVPSEIVELLRSETNLALSDPDVQARLLNEGVEVSVLSPADLKTFLHDEAEKYRRLIAELFPPKK